MDKKKIKSSDFQTGIIFQNILISSSPLSINVLIWETCKIDQSCNSKRISKKKKTKKTSYVLINWVNLLSTAYEATQETE